MPTVFNNDQLDDPLVFDVTGSFEGGMLSSKRSNLLQVDEMADLKNLDLSSSGQLITRRGITQIGPNAGSYVWGSWYYRTQALTQLVIAAGGHMKAYNGSSWNVLTAGNTSVDDGIPVLIAQGVNNLYYMQPTGGLNVYDGTQIRHYLGPTSNIQPPYQATAMVWHTNRLCMSTIANPDTIFFSQFLDGETWDRANWSVKVGSGDGDPIKGLVSWTGSTLLVFKGHNIWVVDCDPTQGPPANFVIRRVHDRIGSKAFRTACMVGSDILFLSDNGVRSVKNILTSEQQKEVGLPLSEPVSTIMGRINQAYISKSCAAHWNNRYILAIPIDNSTIPNAVLVFNTITSSWCGYWLGWNPSCFALEVWLGTERLWFGDGLGNVQKWNSYVPVSQETSASFQDNGVDVPISITTRSFVFNETASPKTGLNCEFEFDASVSSITVQVILDNGPPLPWISFNTGTNFLTLPTTLPKVIPVTSFLRRSFDLQQFGQFRELQLLMTTTGGKMVLRNISLSGWVDTMVLQN